MKKLKRIEKLEKQLSKLKAEIVCEEKINYPCVMESYNNEESAQITVLMNNDSSGTVLSVDSNGCEFGELWNKFNMDYFKPFTGTIEYKDGKPV